MSQSALFDQPPHLVVFGDFEQELSSTRRALERVPDEHWSWKPHAKSYALGELAAHVANIVEWGSVTIAVDDLDLGGIPQNAPPANRAQVLARFDASAEKLRQDLPTLTAESLAATWTLRGGEVVYLTLPRLAALRGFVLSHLIHHRAQLTVYLRLLDVPVPSIYGPSADEAM